MELSFYIRLFILKYINYKNMKHNQNGQIAVQGYGIKLEVDPIILYKQGIHPLAQKQLDEFIEQQWIDLIINKISEKVDQTFVSAQEYESLKTTYCEEIMEYAMFIKNIRPLHSDWEMIKLNEYHQMIDELVSHIFRYNPLYGFVSNENVYIEGNPYNS